MRVEERMKKEAGITLIALIITIIILLILAAVTINAVMQGGFIDIATKGTENYVMEAKRENEMIEKVESTLEEYLLADGKSTIGEKIEEGKLTINVKAKAKENNIKQIIVYEESGENILEKNYEGEQKEVREKIEVYIPFYEEKKYTVVIKDDNNEEIKSDEIIAKNEDTIKTKEDILKLSELTNEGNTFEGETIYIRENINLNENTEFSFDYETNTLNHTGEEPEGWIEMKEFNGTLDGKGNTISNLYMTNNNCFLRSLGAEGIVKDIKFDNTYLYNSFTGNQQTVALGGIIRDSIGTVERVGIEEGVFYSYTDGQSTDWGVVGIGLGGIVRVNRGIINSSYNKANIIGITCKPFCPSYCGGITYANYGEINDCYNLGNIICKNTYSTTSGEVYAVCGGIVSEGNLGGKVNNSWSLCKIEASARYVENGGIIGKEKGGIFNNTFYVDLGEATKGFYGKLVSGMPSITNCGKLDTVASLKSKIQEIAPDKYDFSGEYPKFKWE